MTLADIITALRQGHASPDAQRRAAELLDRLKPAKRGRPSTPYWLRAGALLDRVETLTAKLGSRKRAFEALAAEAKGRQKPATVKRYFRTAKQWEKAQEDWIDKILLAEMPEGDEK